MQWQEHAKTEVPNGRAQEKMFFFDMMHYLQVQQQMRHGSFKLSAKQHVREHHVFLALEPQSQVFFVFVLMGFCHALPLRFCNRTFEVQNTKQLMLQVLGVWAFDPILVSRDESSWHVLKLVLTSKATTRNSVQKSNLKDVKLTIILYIYIYIYNQLRAATSSDHKKAPCRS